MTLLLGLVVFLATAGVHVAAAASTRAVVDYSYRAALWEGATWLCAVVAWVTAVKVSLWYLLPEGVGVVAGALAGVWVLRRRRARTGT